TRLSPRAKAILEVAAYLIFFFPLFYVLVVSSIPYAYNAWVMHETSSCSNWAPILGPMKTVMVVGFLLLGLEGLAQFIRNLSTAIKGLP
ncbi:MAG: TRAP transporter small permease subunit, partial [Chloroflexota bacterium]|nr:TRAP transporter small permease subunit [Chloroflexota bacterium]